MSRFKKDDMQISDSELSAMTAQLDMLHKETFPQVTKTLDEVAADMSHLRTSGVGRRGFLAGVGGVAALGTLAACSSSGGKSAKTTTPATSGTSPSSGSGSAPAMASKYTGDFKVVALAAALENLAVAAYGLALANAQKGKYGTKVPDALAAFVVTAMGQHKDHAAAWNSVLTKSKLPKITGTPVSIAAEKVKMLQAQTTLAGVAKQALALENAAAETYLFAIENVQDKPGIAVAATIEPVETMHAAILNFVLGQYPVPNGFIGTSNAVQPSALTV